MKDLRRSRIRVINFGIYEKREIGTRLEYVYSILKENVVDDKRIGDKVILIYSLY